MNRLKPRSIILLSSGLDSLVSAAVAVKKTRPVWAITFDYGQRAAAMEIRYARKISRHYGIRHLVVPLLFFRNFNRCSLLDPRRKSPGQKFQKITDLWVPNRNAVFINVAAAYAEYFRARLVITGFNREEAAEFPDNRPAFVKAINATLARSTRSRVQVVSYVQNLTKRKIYQLGRRLAAPLELVYSCYLGAEKMCGSCASCRRLLAARHPHAV